MNSIFQKNLQDISQFEYTPDNWREAAVKDVCNLGRGRVINQEEIDQNEGEYPVYSSQTSNKGIMGYLATYDFDEELVTWTTDGANAGTVFHRTGKFNWTNVCGTLKPKSEDEIDLKFLSYHLGRIAKSYVSYIGNPKLMNDVMSKIAFVLPNDRKEQQKIAKILTTVDNLIEKTEAVIEKYQAIKQGVMHDLFTRGIDTNGQLRPSHQDAPHLYKQTELGWIPKEWDVMQLGDVVPKDRPICYGILMPGYGYPNGIQVIKVKDIKGGEIDKTDLLLTDPDIDHQYKRSKVKTGDLLFTIRGTVGRTAFVPRDLHGANITQDTARIAIMKGDSRFIRGYLGMPLPQSFIDNHTLGVAVQGINLRDVRRIPIAFPNNDYEQKEIGERLEHFEKTIVCENRYLEKLSVAKKGLMQDLLTGKVRVKV